MKIPWIFKILLVHLFIARFASCFLCMSSGSPLPKKHCPEKASMSGKKFVTFVTGNAKKLAEVQDIIGDAIPLVSRSLDLPELQGTPEDVSREKCKLAAKAVEGPVLVEDTSLCFNALNGLPGVYIKWFMEGIGHEGLNNLLAAYPDKTAYAQCIFSFSEGKDAEPQPKNFGWDPIFEPQGFGKTYAEMDPAVKNSISHRYRSLEEVKRFFAANPQVLQASAAPPPP